MNIKGATRINKSFLLSFFICTFQFSGRCPILVKTLYFRISSCFFLLIRLLSNFFFLLRIKYLNYITAGLVYRFKCSDYNVTYDEKTKHHFKVCMCELSQIKGSPQTTAVFNHFPNKNNQN